MKSIIKFLHLIMTVFLLQSFNMCKNVPENYDSYRPFEGGYINFGESILTKGEKSPVYNIEGQVHLFVGRWDEGTTWQKEARIDHFIADKPEGPYTFLSTLFQNDSVAIYDPQFDHVEGIYVLVFSIKEKNSPNLDQKLGIATSNSLNGPWKLRRYDPAIGPSFIPGSGKLICIINRALLKNKDENI